MEKKVVLLDGAVGTSLWEKTENKIPVWMYNVEDPKIVKELHQDYIDAGSEIILANTFSANSMSMIGTKYNVKDIVTRGMELAHEAIDGKAKIAFSAGPLTGLIEPFGNVTKEQAYEIYDEMITYGAEGKPDVIFLQTFMDIEMMRIACKAARKHDIPLFCSMSFAKSSPKKGSRTMMGNGVDDIVKGLEEFHPEAVGLNCSMGPDTALPVIKEFSEKTNIPLLFKPNAGKPTLEGGSEFDTSIFAKDVAASLQYGVTYIGGCCGSNAKYIKALKEEIEKA